MSAGSGLAKAATTRSTLLLGYPAQLRSFGEMMAREGFLQVSVGSAGRWLPQGMIGAPGPELAKRQVLPLDLSGIAGDTVRMRLASAPAFWWVDHVALDTSAERAVQVQSLRPVQANDESGRDLPPLLAEVDHRYYVLETGQTAELRFELPSPKPGTRRSYLVQSTGWYRIRAEAEGEPDVTLLDRLLGEPGAASRFTVERMNQLLNAAQLSQRGSR